MIEDQYLVALGDIPFTMTDEQFHSWIKDEDTFDESRIEALHDALEVFTYLAEKTDNEIKKDLLLNRCLIIMEEIHKNNIAND